MAFLRKLKATPSFLFSFFGFSKLNYRFEKWTSLIRKQLFYFMPLQSNAGKKVLQFYDLPSDELSTLVFVYKSKSYTYSAAVFKILSLLEWPWRVFCLFSIFPKVLTDFCYRFYANHRYEWFGKLESCHIPSPEERSRFLGGDD